MPESRMVINYVPGEECRVAIVEDGKLEEFYSERFDAASRVGNIYVGRVTNVEAAIQAAFVDFGVEENGFLHVSDLHPRYFPGEDVDETTERVGHKTPRRERPPIQHCLRRGQEVIVQVLKEGVGTKGPTLTSYLSIPGRFLVMMPQMDHVGVSRKVEDEDLRRRMREILDQLELPEGFGFILRTAGMDRTKLELKRDLAYLQRLWKDMERRLNTGSKPRLLYSESDLLVRCLRDQLNSDIQEVVVDNELALRRASRFMKIVAPRGQTKLLHYPGQAPVFHAFGIEKQILNIHSREVPLPSGGRLVIDQTEALVAIDVNSGKSRDARDAENNAYQTNVEAVDEICRQLRLRDMGGIIVNDLIDMRHASHRKDVEQRFRERLKRDRARSTIAPISPFGILEMTRQRMRGSMESIHFIDCPTCRGRGLVQRPDSVAADALRELAAVLDADRVAKVELVVAPRVASELLSTKRRSLNRIERTSGKHVDVRVSETLPVDRVSFYAYDPAGADIDVAALPQPRKPRDLRAWEDPDAGPDDKTWAIDPEEEKAQILEPEPEPQETDVVEPLPHPIEVDIDDADGEQPAAPGEAGRRGRRRRRRRGRGRAGDDQATLAGPAGRPGPAPSEASREPREPRQPARRPAPTSDAPPTEGEGPQGAEAPPGAPGEEGAPRRKRRRRRRGRGQRPLGPDGQPLPPDAVTADGPAGAVDQPFSDSAGPEFDAPSSEPRSGLEPAEPGDDEGPADGGMDDDGQPMAEGQPGEGGEGGEGGRRRRRRRRRRGRGRAGEGGEAAGPAPAGGPPAGHTGQSGHGGHAPRGGHRGGPGPQRGESGGGRPSGYSNRVRGRGGASSDNGGQSRPASAPNGDSGGGPSGGAGGQQPPRPRLLYTSRRKLSPSELNKRPKPE
ncbi:MAG: Rne/Rng family ribonuclease [Phycisphaerales bacterium]|nr:Rne/Rng family ribonuclease [Phycisphaerales bacterium]